jgi:hypothetical protein
MYHFRPFAPHFRDASDKVKLEKGKVGQVLTGEKLATKMRMDESYTPETGAAGPFCGKRRDLDAAVVPDYDIFDHSAPVDDEPYLAGCFP